MYEKDTTEANGVEVIVPIRYGDIWNFENACRQKLCYYETVTMILRGQLVSDYKIYREEDFQYNTLFERYEMHICLKDVVYDIDWGKLGRNRIHLPVALRFDLSSGLTPTPSREGIIFNKESIKIINDKIDKVEKWFIDKYNESVKNATVKEALNKAIFDSYNLRIYDKTFNLNAYKARLDFPSIDGITNLRIKELVKHNDKILFDYDKMGYIYNDRYVSHDYGGCLKYLLDNYHTVILADRKPSGKQLQYIKDTYGEKAVFIKKNDKRKVTLWKSPGTYSGANDWYTFLGLKNVPRANWRKCFEELETIRQELIKGIVDIEDVKPTEEWLNDQKVAKTRKAVTKVDKAEINPKWAKESVNYNNLCKFESDGVSLISSLSATTTFVYGKYEQREKLGELYHLTLPINNFQVCILVDRDINRIKDAQLTNWLNIEEFMEGKLSVFGATCTANLIREFVNKYALEFKNTEFISKFDKDLAEKMVELDDFQNQYSRGLDRNTELLKEMMEICGKENLWKDKEYELYNEVSELIEDLSFLKFLKTKNQYGNYSTGFIHESCEEFAKNYYNNLKINKLQTV